MDIIAQLNNLRIAPRKVRAVIRVVKGLEIEEAKISLKYLGRRPSHPLIKLIDSAVANAVNNFGLEKEVLYIKDIVVSEGMKLKRFRPKSRGLVSPIQKKTSKIKIILDKLPEEKIKEIKKIKERRIITKPVEEIKPETPEVPEELVDKEDINRKPVIKKEFTRGPRKPKFEGVKTLGRKLFRRKAIG